MPRKIKPDALFTRADRATTATSIFTARSIIRRDASIA
jgi:hypothetical protein